jgi:hypothetical protein
VNRQEQLIKNRSIRIPLFLPVGRAVGSDVGNDQQSIFGRIASGAVSSANGKSKSGHVVAFFDQQNVIGTRQDEPVTADARSCWITERKHSAGLGNDGDIPLVFHYADHWHVDKSI